MKQKILTTNNNRLVVELFRGDDMDRVFTQKIQGYPTSAKEIEDAFQTVGIIVRAKIERLCNEQKFEEAKKLEKALVEINNADYNH